MIDAMEGWVSPIELIYEDAKNTFLEQTDEHIIARCEAVLGVKVDRDELIKALNYDREQYEKGYHNGYERRNKEIVRCKNCIYRLKEWRDDKRMKDKGYWVYGCEHFAELMGYWGWGGDDYDFCSYGERKETEKKDTEHSDVITERI